MRWDHRLGDLLDDLEQQADGLALAQRDAEVAELARAEFAQMELATRLHGSLGRRLLLDIGGVGVLDGVLSRVGSGWCLLDTGAREWLLRTGAVRSLRGLAERGLVPQVLPVTARLGMGSALRSLAGARVEVVLHRVDGVLTRGHLERVGADFLELRAGDGAAGYLETVPFDALAAVCTWS
jgi:hypothetical protein